MNNNYNAYYSMSKEDKETVNLFYDPNFDAHKMDEFFSVPKNRETYPLIFKKLYSKTSN